MTKTSTRNSGIIQQSHACMNIKRQKLTNLLDKSLEDNTLMLIRYVQWKLFCEVKSARYIIFIIIILRQSLTVQLQQTSNLKFLYLSLLRDGITDMCPHILLEAKVCSFQQNTIIILNIFSGKLFISPFSANKNHGLTPPSEGRLFQ